MNNVEKEYFYRTLWVLIILFINPFIIQLFWNYFIIDIINVKIITYWQAFIINSVWHLIFKVNI